MKKALFICCLLIGFTAFAQQQGKGQQRHGKQNMERPDYTPEQIAELKTKKLTLMLDLNESQQQKINNLELESAKARKQMIENRKQGEKPSDEDRFERQNAMLDRQIAYKNSMKSILTKDQYEKWEKSAMAKHKKRKQGRMKGRKGKNRQ